jgi:hypothetical protein
MKQRLVVKLFKQSYTLQRKRVLLLVFNKFLVYWLLVSMATVKDMSWQQSLFLYFGVKINPL